MREHPIPQDITNYRFHIVGSMTIKQFVEVAGGVMVGVLIYNTNLPGALKWVMIVISALIGFAAAFLPIEERPLSHWLITFFSVLYKPTQFFWRRDPKIPDSFLFQANPNTEPLTEEVDFSPLRRQRIKDYLGSINNQNNNVGYFDEYETQRLNQILMSFGQFDDKVPHGDAQKLLMRPQLGTRIRNLNATNYVRHGFSDEQLIYEQTTTDQSYEFLDQNQQLDQFSNQELPVDQVAQEIQIPVFEDIAVEPIIDSNTLDQTGDITVEELSNFSQVQADVQHHHPTEAVSYNTSLPFPSVAKEPNKPVGMVLTPHNELITAAVVQIIDSKGVITRAVKTNALGQFYVTTPLLNGKYTLLVEKDGFAFAPLSLELSGQQVEPIEVRSLLQ